MPASVTRATSSPSRSRSTSRAGPRSSVFASRRSSFGAGTPSAVSSARVRRVSSQAITAALARVSRSRGVTSPRLPIGVPQIRSVPGVMGARGRPHRSCRRRCRGWRRRAVPHRSAATTASRRIFAARGRIRSAPASPRPPPITNTSGASAFASETRPAPSAADSSSMSASACSSPRAARAQDVVRVAEARLASASPERRAGAVRLQVAAPGARALAGPSVALDHDVPELAACSAGARQQPAIGDDAASDARAERQRDGMGRAGGRAEPVLAERRAVPVVLDQHGRVELAPEEFAQCDVPRAAG